MRRRALLPALLGLALLAPTGASVAATPAGPGPTTSLSLSLGSCGFSGVAAGIEDDQLTIKHRSSTGALKASRTVDTSGDDWFVVCSGPRMRGGDQLKLFSGDATTPFRTFTVPALTLQIDRANDRVSGTAPRTSSIDVRVVSCGDAAGFGCTGLLPLDLPVNPDTDKFAADVPDDLVGGWRIELTWEKAQDTVWLTQQVPQLIVRPGTAAVRGWAQRPGAGVAVSLRRGQNVGTTSPTAKADADFQGTFKRGGSPMKVRALDVVSSSIAADAVLTVPTTSLTLVSGGVEGRCFKNRTLAVLVYNATGGGPMDWAFPTADANGLWAADVTVNAGWIVRAWCANARGDVVLRTLVAN